MHKFMSVTQMPPNVAVTVVAELCCRLTYNVVHIHDIFRHCDLLVLKMIIPNQCHVKKVKIKKTFLHTVIVKVRS